MLRDGQVKGSAKVDKHSYVVDVQDTAQTQPADTEALKKYVLLKNVTATRKGQKLYRIRALKDFGKIKAGEIGGFIASEKNLSQQGLCWVGDDAKVHNARLYDNVSVSGSTVLDDDISLGGKGEITGQIKFL